jgi:hypothetical protein
MKLMEHPYNIFFDHSPTNLEESHSKTIRTLRLITIHTFHHLKDLTLLKRVKLDLPKSY